jgi:hypothetical protein
VLRLGCGLDENFAIVAKFLEPSGNVGGLIRDDCVRDFGFGTKVSASHLRDQFLFRVRRGAEGESAATDSVLAEHPNSIGTGKVLPKSTTGDDDIDASHRPTGLINGGGPVRDFLLSFGRAGEQSLGHLDVARHPDMRVSIQRFAE